MNILRHALLVFLCGMGFRSMAHPMPNSVVLLDIRTNGVNVELQLPLKELGLALGKELQQLTPQEILRDLQPDLKNYILNHFHAYTPDNTPWAIAIDDMEVTQARQTATGPYQELKVGLTMTAPVDAPRRKFRLEYDVIIHQVVTHQALISIRQDWQRGLHGENPAQIGVVQLDISSNTVKPLLVNEKEGSYWTGFKSVVHLGMKHIGEGTDHLLFLLVLLIPAPLTTALGKWSSFGGSRHSVIGILKIVTAFTIGHSLTMLTGALWRLKLPAQPVETLIAFSIFVSAVHALRPIFSGKEVFVVGGFGLIHGLAFASTLVDLHLQGGQAALSIFGFNIGIELMQLFIVLITFPWLILLSQSRQYPVIRIVIAVLAAFAALAWMIDRVTLSPNPVSGLLSDGVKYAPLLVLLLALLAVALRFRERRLAARTYKNLWTL